MILRSLFPTARVAGARFTVTFTLPNRKRSFVLPSSLFYVLFGVVPVLALWYLCATLYLIFRDEMLSSVAGRGSQDQYGYEETIASLRSEVERQTSRQLLDQNRIESEVRALLGRAAKLENRAAIVSTLADRATSGIEARDSLGSVKISTPTSSNTPLLGNKNIRVPESTSAYAPLSAGSLGAIGDGGLGQSKPNDLELRSSHSGDEPDAAPIPPRSDKHASLLGEGKSAIARLDRIASALDRIDQDQVRALIALQKPALSQTAQIRAALAQAGLSEDRLSQRLASSRLGGNEEDVGGPFIPLDDEPGGKIFEHEAIALQSALMTKDRLQRIIPHVPLRQPLLTAYDITSGFGPRLDPFFGRPALHTGLDMRGAYGAAVHATAAGRVVIADVDGGYGRMVEIDHGNGLATRYAHLSAILVAPNQLVTADQIIGQIGSSGRSTGPHLHYETRIDGEPVDPTRFLRAATMLSRLAEATP